MVSQSPELKSRGFFIPKTSLIQTIPSQKSAPPLSLLHPFFSLFLLSFDMGNLGTGKIILRDRYDLRGQQK